MQWLIDRLNEWGDAPALVWNHQLISYSEILQKYVKWLRVIDQGVLNDRHTVSVYGDYSPEVCSLLLALISRNKIIIPLTTASQPQMNEFKRIAEVQIEIRIDAQDQWRMEQRDTEVTHHLSRELIASNLPGLVLFSSGSTGKPKAAIHNFENLLNKFKVRRHRYVAMNFLLFDHIGGINTLLYNFSNGGLVVTTRTRNPEEICSLIEKFKIELLPTTPTFLNMLLLSEAIQHFDLSTLKLITYGTEVMPESLLLRVSNALPHAKLLQTYGLSELGIMRSKSQSSDSLWMKIGGEDYETKVVKNILWIKAKSSMKGYLNAPNPFTPDGWFITGDTVEQNGDYIKILGRESDIINVGGQKVYPSEVESVLLKMPGVSEIAVFGEPHMMTGQCVVARVQLDSEEPLRDFKKRMRRYCNGKLTAYKVPQKLLPADSDLRSSRYKKVRK